MILGSNAPDTYSDSTTFSSTPVLVDNGAVQIWQTQTATAGGGEWDLFYMLITSGGPLANNIDADWNITIDYTLTQPADFDEGIFQWMVSGVPVSPINNFSGICCATTTPPILSGPAYYNSGFNVDLSAGLQSNWEEIYIDPYDYVSAGGIDPSTANEFVFGLHFDPVPSATPEPASMSLLGAGLIAMGFFWRNRGRGRRPE